MEMLANGTLTDSYVAVERQFKGRFSPYFRSHRSRNACRYVCGSLMKFYVRQVIIDDKQAAYKRFKTDRQRKRKSRSSPPLIMSA
jgi:hypothetical protein